MSDGNRGVNEAGLGSGNRFDAEAKANVQTKTGKKSGWKAVIAVVLVLAFLICGALTVRNMPVIGRVIVTESSSGVKESAEERAVYTEEESEAPAFSDMSVKNAGAMPKISAAGGMAATDTDGKKIVRTLDITIGTKTFDDTLSGIRAACEAGGGWVDYASEDTERNGRRTGYLSLRIPEDKLEEFDGALIASGRVIRISESASDVTEGYRDNSSRLETQKALLSRLKALIADATDVNDIISLESRISDTQEMIDSLQRSLDRTDKDVSYTSVNVQVIEETAAEDAGDAVLGFGERAAAAVGAGLKAFGGFMQDMAVFLIYSLPFLICLGVIVIIAAIIVRHNRRRK